MKCHTAESRSVVLRRFAVALASGWMVFSAMADPGNLITRHPFPAQSSFVLTDDHPGIAANRSGDFVVVWTTVTDPDVPDAGGIWGRRFKQNGVPYADQFRITLAEGAATPRVSDSEIAMNGDGDFVVVWYKSSAFGADQVLGRRFDPAGAPKEQPFVVSPAAQEVIGLPVSVAIASDGAFVVIWGARDPDFDDIAYFGQRFSAAGERSGQVFRIAPAWSLAAVAMNGEGGFVTIWDEATDGGGTRLRGRRYDSSGQQAGGDFTVSDPGAGRSATSASIAMRSNGEFFVVYSRNDLLGTFGSESLGLFARRYSALAARQGGEIRVSKPGTVDFRGQVDTAINSRGDLAVSWIAGQVLRLGGTSFLHTRLLDASGNLVGKDHESLFPEIRDPNGPGPSNSTVAIDGMGRFVAAWQQQSENPDESGHGDNIFAQRYAGPDDTRASCGGYIASKVGTSGSDVISGTSGDDVIQALGGNDIVYGSNGADILCGGDQDDQLFGESGTDRLLGQTGDDFLTGGSGIDICDGGPHVNSDTAVGCEATIHIP